jgi:predicted transcriptional regulator
VSEDRRLSLYHITEEILTLESMSDGTDEEVETRLGEFLGELLPAKVENYAKFMRTLELEAEAFKAEEKRLKERRQSLEKFRERMMSSLKDSMEVLECRELKAGVFTARLANSPAYAAILNQHEVPMRFKVIEEKIDKAALKAALKAGETVPGAELRQGKHVRIK